MLSGQRPGQADTVVNSLCVEAYSGWDSGGMQRAENDSRCD